MTGSSAEEQSSSVQTTGVSDDPNCTCCEPGQPLTPPDAGDKYWTCPVTGKKYSYDVATGEAREFVPPSAEQVVNREPANSGSPGNLYPEEPDREEIQRVNPEDPFANPSTL